MPYGTESNMELNKIYQGDSLEVLKTFPDNSINCCVTSPPYYGLRDYGTAKWEGGDINCNHKSAKEKSRYDYSLANSPIQDGTRTGTDCPKYKNTCPDCGARRIDNQIGLEETPEEYIKKMTDIFCEIRRVLRKDGTCWLNLGDSYSSGGNGSGYSKPCKQDTNRGMIGIKGNPKKAPVGYKEKEILGIPWRAAFALQSDGWYLRQDIIWAKPNPMPESVTDRCTRSHEYIFLLTKSKKYYFNQMLEAAKYTERWGRHNKIYNESERMGLDSANSEERNKRDVWTVNTKPFSETHFAIFPEELIEPMILAGCPKEGIVLDPFMGSGTTALVAYRFNRKYIGIELNPEYIKIAEKRLKNETIPLF